MTRKLSQISFPTEKQFSLFCRLPSTIVLACLGELEDSGQSATTAKVCLKKKIYIYVKKKSENIGKNVVFGRYGLNSGGYVRLGHDAGRRHREDQEQQQQQQNGGREDSGNYCPVAKL